MVRDLVWHKENGKMAACLGISPARQKELDAFVNSYIERNATLRELVEDLNARGDLTDAEWTTVMYTIGYYQGERA